jgi:hypothetical protein
MPSSKHIIPLLLPFEYNVRHNVIIIITIVLRKGNTPINFGGVWTPKYPLAMPLGCGSRCVEALLFVLESADSLRSREFYI